MSVKAMAWAWGQPIGGTLKLVLMALADHADDEGRCWPGTDGLAEKCSCARPTVTRNVRMLEKMELVTVDKSRVSATGRQLANLYVLSLTSAAKAATTTTTYSGEGINLIPLSKHGEGITGDMGEGITGDTPSSLNPHREPSEEEKRETAAFQPPTVIPQGVGISKPEEKPEVDRASSDWILAEWKKIPGVMHPVRLLTGIGLDKALTIKLRKHPQRAWWLELFATVAASPWLCGAIEPGGGKARFCASLCWVLLPKNMAKTLQGDYLRRPGDRPSVRGKFDPRGTMEWAADLERQRIKAERKELAHDGN